MPTYDYYCDANGTTLEVKHKISENVTSWGELCTRTHSNPGTTPADSPVRRLITGSAIVSSTGSGPEPACASGGCCPAGVCGFPQ
ncbi:MAG: zinc ribbon domain-containing protein [Gammaproteobacteria bacterium]|nr:zinc ribbon domain-containing protein [Gammaproteobacteria bacterium]